MPNAYHQPSTFLRAPSRPVGSGLPRVAVMGALFDLSTTFRPGARFGPAAIRTASAMFSEDDDVETGISPAQALDLFDAGDVIQPQGDVPGGLAAIEARAGILMADAHLLTLGGDHLISLPLLRAAHRRHGQLAMVHFDAHCDTWPPADGTPTSHGSPFWFAIEEGLIDPAATVQIGLRSPVARDVVAWTRQRGVTWITARDVLTGDLGAIATRVRALIGNRPTYMTFDIDVLDPSQAPGVSTPEIAGLWTWQAQELLRLLRFGNFVAADIVEVCPPYDQSDITAVAAATLAWTWLVGLAQAAAAA